MQVTRASEPWEFSDGAVYLVREMCVVDPERGVEFFEEMADIARLTQFVQADSLRETMWKQVITRGTGNIVGFVVFVSFTIDILWYMYPTP